MNFLDSLLLNLKNVLKANKKYIDENIIDIVFNNELIRIDSSEALYINNFLKQFTKNLIKSNCNKNFVNEEIVNQVPHFLIYLIISYKTIKEFLDKNIKIIEPFFKNSLIKESCNDFLEELIYDNSSTQELFLEKFLDYLKKTFLNFLKYDNKEKISLVKLQELLREDLNLNYFDIFSTEEIESLRNNLIWNIYENIKLNIIDKFEDENSEEETEEYESKEKLTFSYDLKFSIKSIKNINQYFDSCHKENSNCFSFKIKFIEGYLLENTNDSYNESDNNFNLKDYFNKEKINNEFNYQGFEFSFLCLISDDFFSFTKKKLVNKNEINNEEIKNNLIIEDLDDDEIKEKLSMISSIFKAYSINLLVSKVKIDNFVKNYFRKFQIRIIDRIPNWIYCEIIDIFQIKILSSMYITDLEKIKEKFKHILKSNLDNHVNNHVKKPNQELDKKKFSKELESIDLKSIEITKNLIEINKSQYDLFSAFYNEFSFTKDFIFLGNNNNNNEQNENRLDKKELSIKNNFEKSSKQFHDSLDLIFIEFCQKNNFDILNIADGVLIDLISKIFYKELLNKSDNKHKKFFNKFYPKTILINKLKGKLNEARIKSLNFILDKYSNLILDKLNEEENSEFISKKLSDLGLYFSENLSKEHDIIIQNDLILNIEGNLNNKSERLITMIFEQLFCSIINRYKENIISDYQIAKEMIEIEYQLKEHDKFLINLRNINFLTDAIKFFFHN